MLHILSAAHKHKDLDLLIQEKPSLSETENGSHCSIPDKIYFTPFPSEIAIFNLSKNNHQVTTTICSSRSSLQAKLATKSLPNQTEPDCYHEQQIRETAQSVTICQKQHRATES
jgi:hypothetical protein